VGVADSEALVWVAELVGEMVWVTLKMVGTVVVRGMFWLPERVVNVRVRLAVVREREREREGVGVGVVELLDWAATAATRTREKERRDRMVVERDGVRRPHGQ
jgi:hypothetical protein